MVEVAAAEIIGNGFDPAISVGSAISMTVCPHQGILTVRLHNRAGEIFAFSQVSRDEALRVVTNLYTALAAGAEIKTDA